MALTPLKRNSNLELRKSWS